MRSEKRLTIYTFEHVVFEVLQRRFVWLYIPLFHSASDTVWLEFQDTVTEH